MLAEGPADPAADGTAPQQQQPQPASAADFLRHGNAGGGVGGMASGGVARPVGAGERRSSFADVFIDPFNSTWVSDTLSEASEHIQTGATNFNRSVSGMMKDAKHNFESVASSVADVFTVSPRRLSAAAAPAEAEGDTSLDEGMLRAEAGVGAAGLTWPATLADGQAPPRRDGEHDEGEQRHLRELRQQDIAMGYCRGCNGNPNRAPGTPPYCTIPGCPGNLDEVVERNERLAAD